MEDWPPPSYEDMRRVMAHVYDACRRHWMPIGAAPNIEVSLVVNPDDAALLAERTLGFYTSRSLLQGGEDRGEADLRAPSPASIVGTPPAGREPARSARRLAREGH